MGPTSTPHPIFHNFIFIGAEHNIKNNKHKISPYLNNYLNINFCYFLYYLINYYYYVNNYYYYYYYYYYYFNNISCYSLLLTPYSLLLTPYSLLPTPYSL